MNKLTSKCIDQYIDRVMNYELLTEKEIMVVCDRICDIMILEPNIRSISGDTFVVGDIHGQFSDLLYIFKTYGSPGANSYVFQGDYVDRGENSLECIVLLLLYKIAYPGNITLIRGNHEQRTINKTYGFYDEVMLKYGNPRVWNMINDVFPYFNLGCIIENRYLCIHGGISPRVTKNKLERVDRFEKITEDSIINDIIWSDPYYKPGFAPNPRGSGFLFGIDILKQFLIFNNIEMIIRSHQLAIEGYKFDFEGLCLTVWSAPDYMGKCSNPGSILFIEKDVPITSRSLRIFKKTKRML